MDTKQGADAATLKSRRAARYKFSADDFSVPVTRVSDWLAKPQTPSVLLATSPYRPATVFSPHWQLQVWTEKLNRYQTTTLALSEQGANAASLDWVYLRINLQYRQSGTRKRAQTYATQKCFLARLWGIVPHTLTPVATTYPMEVISLSKPGKPCVLLSGKHIKDLGLAIMDRLGTLLPRACQPQQSLLFDDATLSFGRYPGIRLRLYRNIATYDSVRQVSQGYYGAEYTVKPLNNVLIQPGVNAVQYRLSQTPAQYFSALESVARQRMTWLLNHVLPLPQSRVVHSIGKRMQAHFTDYRLANASLQTTIQKMTQLHREGVKWPSQFSSHQLYQALFCSWIPWRVTYPATKQGPATASGLIEFGRPTWNNILEAAVIRHLQSLQEPAKVKAQLAFIKAIHLLGFTTILTRAITPAVQAATRARVAAWALQSQPDPGSRRVLGPRRLTPAHKTCKRSRTTKPRRLPSSVTAGPSPKPLKPRRPA